MSKQESNGWTNSETWLVNLYYGEHIFQLVRDDNVKASDIKEQILECVDYDSTKVSPFLMDLIGYAIGKVNWHELYAFHLDAVERDR